MTVCGVIMIIMMTMMVKTFNLSLSPFQPRQYSPLPSHSSIADAEQLMKDREMVEDPMLEFLRKQREKEGQKAGVPGAHPGQ